MSITNGHLEPPRRRWLAVGLLVGALGALWFNSESPGDPAPGESASKEKDMPTATTPLEAGRASLPPIDLAAPKETRTATFALG